MTEHDEILERAIDTLKKPVTIDAALDRRVMSAIEEMRALSGQRLTFARRFRITPLRGLAAAAAIAAVVFASSLLMREPDRVARPAGGEKEVKQVTQFVLIAPNAQSVSLVGDFNDWDLAATRLTRQPGDGVWWVTIALPPGRYRYAYVVDGANWRNDPSAPSADDEFGRPNSVVTIGGA